MFHSALPPKARLNIQRGRDRAGQDCTIETRAVAGVEIVETWVPTKSAPQAITSLAATWRLESRTHRTGIRLLGRFRSQGYGGAR